MEFEAFQKITRYSRECIITEKIDGTNAQIFIVETETPDSFQGIENAIAYNMEIKALIFAGSKKRFITPSDDNHGFARWVSNNADELFRLGPGRHFGEWWGYGIERGYGLKEKRFSLFNVHRWGDDSVRPACCHVVPVMTRGLFTTTLVTSALEDLKMFGSKAVPGFMRPEGIIIYHTAGNLLFKKTIERDESPKGEKE